MALRLSTGLRNGLLDANPYKTLMNATASTLIFYTGTQPASSDDAITGSHTVLATYNTAGSNSLVFGSAASGALAISASKTATASASGTAGWFRFGDDSAVAHSAASTVVARMDGAVGTTGAEINFPGGTTITSGAPIVINTFTINMPAS